MIREQFLKYMRSPDSLDDKSLGELDEIIRDYPYFQTARLLYVRNLKNLDNIKYEDRLKLTAAYATDRKMLYYLLNEEPREITEMQEQDDLVVDSKEVISEESEKAEGQSVPEKEAIKVQEEITVVKDEDEKSETVTMQPEKDPVVQETESAGADMVERQEEKEEELKEEKEEEEKSAIPEEKKEEITIEDKEVKEVIEEEAKEEEKEKTEVQEERKEVEETGEGKTVISAETDRNKKMEQIASAIKDKKKESLADEILQRLAELKKEKKEKKDQERPESPAEVKDPGAEIAGREVIAQDAGVSEDDEGISSFSDWLEAASSKKKKDVPEMPDTELIDRFLKQDHQIKPLITGDENQEDISRESVMEQEDFITETLAEIYLQQGFYEKALNAYEKLRLNSLEKSVYFAEQVEKLEKKIKEQ